MKPAKTLRQIALVLCLSSTTIYLTSCELAEHEPLVAEGLLTGEPCGPPCWQGLVPGSSTEDDVGQFLRPALRAVYRRACDWVTQFAIEPEEFFHPVIAE